MCHARNADKVLRIEKARPSLKNIVYRDWVYVVNVDSALNAVALKAHVASVVSNDYVPSSSAPFWRRIKVLIEKTAVAERVFSNFSVELKVIEAFFERLEI